MTPYVGYCQSRGLRHPLLVTLTLAPLVDHPFLKLSAMSQPMHPLLLLGSWLIQML